MPGDTIASGPGGSVSFLGPWGAIGTMMGSLSRPAVIENALDKAIAKEAHRMRALIVKEFKAQGPSAGGWAPLSEATLAMRARRGFKGTKALMETGFLRSSIRVTQEEDNVYFVGVHRTVQRSEGGPLVNIAAVHENGARITFFGTPATIPARPFIGPVWTKEGAKSGERIAEDTMRNLGFSSGLRL